MSDAGEFFGASAVLVICFVLYFLPAIIGPRRHHPNTTAITVLNLFLGWTLVGSVTALVWALMVSQVAPKATQADGDRYLCPVCGESISVHARCCRFCNHQIA